MKAFWNEQYRQEVVVKGWVLFDQVILVLSEYVGSKVARPAQASVSLGLVECFAQGSAKPNLPSALAIRIHLRTMVRASKWEALEQEWLIVDRNCHVGSVTAA